MSQSLKKLARKRRIKRERAIANIERMLGMVKGSILTGVKIKGWL